jgi:putative flippase GtrA
MKQILQKIKEAIKKHEELIKYLIIGVLTTVINYIIFAILVKLANIEMHVSNIIAWLVSVIFAYFTNKLFVFESKSFKLKVIGKEVLSFGAARIFSLGLEEVILYVFVNLLNMNELIIKLIANVIVIIVNYILSKFIIFKKDSK